MTFEQLNYFLEVTRSMNFTKAANNLYISQPTLSRHISTLESDLGAKLLIRDKRSVTLTEAGKLLASEGAELFRKKEEIESRIWRLGEGIKGNLTMVSIEIQSREVYQICRQFQMTYPNIVFSLQQQAYGTTLTEVEERRADVGVGLSFELENLPSNMELLPICKDQFCVIVSELHPLADQESVCVDQLKHETFIFARSMGPTEFVSQLHHKIGADSTDLDNPHQPHGIGSLIMQVKAGLGIALLPRCICRENDGYRALPIRDIDTSFDIVLLWERESGNPNLDCFKDSAREYLLSRNHGACTDFGNV